MLHFVHAPFDASFYLVWGNWLLYKKIHFLLFFLVCYTNPFVDLMPILIHVMGCWERYTNFWIEWTSGHCQNDCRLNGLSKFGQIGCWTNRMFHGDRNNFPLADWNTIWFWMIKLTNDSRQYETYMFRWKTVLSNFFISFV